MEEQWDLTPFERHQLNHVLRDLSGQTCQIDHWVPPRAPAAALRRAITAAILEYSSFPLLAAAELLLEECRNADANDPEWQAFLLRLSQAEVEAFILAERRVDDRGAQRRAGPPHLHAVT